LEALAEKTGEEAPDKPVFEMHLNDIGSVAAVVLLWRLERDRPHRRIAAPVREALAALARPNPQIVECIVPARILAKRWIFWIELVGLHLANRWPTSDIKRIARARERSGSNAMQILGISQTQCGSSWTTTVLRISTRRCLF
jgi:hypothetical protein